MQDIKIRSLREAQKEKMEKAEEFFQKKLDVLFEEHPVKTV